MLLILTSNIFVNYAHILKLNKIVVYYLKRKCCSTKLYINSVISFVTVIKIKIVTKNCSLKD